jgi:hypothetical protein
MRGIKITPVLNGWKCHVGCQEVVFTSKEEMLEKLGAYIDNPNETEEQFLKDAVNKHIVGGIVETSADCGARGPSGSGLGSIAGDTCEPPNQERTR